MTRPPLTPQTIWVSPQIDLGLTSQVVLCLYLINPFTMPHDHKKLPLSSRARGVTLGAVRILNLGFGIMHGLCLNAWDLHARPLGAECEPNMRSGDSLCNVRMVLSADLTDLSPPTWAKIVEVLGQCVAM